MNKHKTRLVAKIPFLVLVGSAVLEATPSAANPEETHLEANKAVSATSSKNSKRCLEEAVVAVVADAAAPTPFKARKEQTSH